VSILLGITRIAARTAIATMVVDFAASSVKNALGIENCKKLKTLLIQEKRKL